MSFDRWVRHVDALMSRRYLITTTDAGWSASDLLRHFNDGVEAAAFVRWFGDKYDLTSVFEIGLQRRARRAFRP